MSVCYWGDIFYGVDRINDSHLFDEDKERKVILKALIDLMDEDDFIEYIQDNQDINFLCDVSDIADNGINDLLRFLDNTNVAAFNPYACNQDVLFFGMHFILPWQVKSLTTKLDTDINIYNALKPILKDSVTFEVFRSHLCTFVINGADDYVTYYSLDTKED